MSLLMIEGFEWLNATVSRDDIEPELLKHQYWFADFGSGATDVVVPTRTGLQGLEFGDSHDFYTRKLQALGSGADKTLIIGFYMKTPATFLAGSVFLQILATADLQVELECASAGSSTAIKLNRSSSTLLSTSVWTMSASTEYYFEFKFVFDDTTGSIEMKVADLTSDEEAETTTEWTATGLDTVNSTSSPWRDGWDQVRFHGMNVGMVIDDIYICNGAGSEANDFLGNLVVEALQPDGAGNDSGLTPSTGLNYQNVDEVAPSDDGTTYNEADANGEIDLYTLTELSNGGDIAGVSVHSEVLVTEGNPRKMRLPIRSGGTTDEGSDITIGNDTYVGRRRIMEINPNTGSAWTQSEIVSLEAGIKRQS